MKRKAEDIEDFYEEDFNPRRLKKPKKLKGTFFTHL